MTSWRDSTTEAVQQDLDELFGVSLDAALQFLSTSGEFFPFGVAMSTDGEVGLFAPGDLGEHPVSTDVLRELLVIARARQSDWRAASLVTDVSVDGGDAVRVSLEHCAAGPALEILAPYKSGRLSKKLTVGQIRTGEGSRAIWLGDA